MYLGKMLIEMILGLKCNSPTSSDEVLGLILKSSGMLG